MALCIIALGSNLGDRNANLDFAKTEIVKLASVLNTSRVYETDPVGYEAQGKFLNAVILIDTKLAPFELLEALQKIEILAKRERPFKNAPRTLDLDIILYEDVNMDTEVLKIPHPLWQERAFVVEPILDLVESAPEILEKFNLERNFLCEILEKLKGDF